MRHNTINNKYNISVDTNQGGSTELDEGEMLEGEVAEGYAGARGPNRSNNG